VCGFSCVCVCVCINIRVCVIVCVCVCVCVCVRAHIAIYMYIHLIYVLHASYIHLQRTCTDVLSFFVYISADLKISSEYGHGGRSASRDAIDLTHLALPIKN